ncbi:MAG: hypothetical protein H7Y04_02425 [Verrucomicrobia bacterium]|nr:hypothetical protein [Cytophagales bacterium]
MSEFIIVKAELTIYPTEQGGRELPIISGYRPNHVFEYSDNGQSVRTFIGDVNFEQAFFYPGETNEVFVRFLKVKELKPLILIGKTWFLQEGKIKVGKAIIQNLIEE